MVEGFPDVSRDVVGLIGAPDQTAGEEDGEQDQAVVQLRSGAGHVQLVEEPVEVQKRGGQLVQDEGRAVIVDEWALENNEKKVNILLNFFYV